MAKTSRTSSATTKPGSKAASKPGRPARAGGSGGGGGGGGDRTKKKTAKASEPAKKPAAAPIKRAAKPAADDKKGGKHVARTEKKPAPEVTGGSAVAVKAPRPAPPASIPDADSKPARPPAADAASQADDGTKKLPPKGITVVPGRPIKKAKTKSKIQMPVSEPLIKPGAPKWKPLIPSGPKAGGRHNALDGAALSEPPKNKLTKRELDRYREVLMKKRSELVGDISTMEDEALRQSSGSLSHTPQHMAEQGTDTFDQSMSLDLAAVDRTLIREIDAALLRIEAGTYGVCELTGKQIRPERLAELPWARYSIEAARELERRPYQT